MAACWRLVSGLLAACWRLVGGLLAACWRLVGGLLAACWRLVGGLLAACWRLVGGLLAACWRLAGGLLAACWRLCCGQRVRRADTAPTSSCRFTAGRRRYTVQFGSMVQVITQASRSQPSARCCSSRHRRRLPQAVRVIKPYVTRCRFGSQVLFCVDDQVWKFLFPSRLIRSQFKYFDDVEDFFFFTFRRICIA